LKSSTTTLGQTVRMGLHEHESVELVYFNHPTS